MKRMQRMAVVAVLTALLLTSAPSASASGTQANVALSNASATFSQTSDTAWTLKKNRHGREQHVHHYLGRYRHRGQDRAWLGI